MSEVQDNKDIMLEVISSIMMDMFFLFPDVDDEGMEITQKENQDDAVYVEIHYHTDSYLHIGIDKPIVHEMAANFIGLMPDEVKQEDMESMALECANILGGNYLVRIDPESKCQLSIPQVIHDTNINDCEWKIGFVSDGSVLNIALRKR